MRRRLELERTGRGPKRNIPFSGTVLTGNGQTANGPKTGKFRSRPVFQNKFGQWVDSKIQNGQTGNGPRTGFLVCPFARSSSTRIQASDVTVLDPGLSERRTSPRPGSKRVTCQSSTWIQARITTWGRGGAIFVKISRDCKCKAWRHYSTQIQAST